MQPTIQLLSNETINQIAAGEVIESPASVIKELVENALDAYAKKITIEITGGGLKKICISDDGKGMSAIDAKLCIERHATSKIQKPQDLFTVMTKGFRGEALASIASISKMTIATAIEGESGTFLEVEKGEVVKERKCARNHGTTIEVASLFYSVPARKKFQKTAAAISAEIFRIVTHLALSHPEVSFTLLSNGRKALQTYGAKNSLEERAKQLLGEDFILGSFPLAFKEEKLAFSGILGAPTNTRNNKMGQYLFINHRFVQCHAIEKAVRAGYGTRLDDKRHPVFLLHLQIPGDLVDVNVHPQKLEVRLRSEELLFSALQRAVEEALSKQVKMQSVQPRYENAFKEVAVDFEEESLLLKEEGPTQMQLEVEPDDFILIGQFSKYLFLEGHSVDPTYEGIVLVDLEAARFRVLFEDLLKKDKGVIASQGLLVPFSIDVTSVEGAMILTHLSAIEEMGFSLRPFGKDIFMVEAIPPLVKEDSIKLLITDMAHSLQKFIGKRDYEKERREKLALMTASYAKAGGPLAKEEAMHLFKKLRACASPFHCPKGNPTMVHLNEETIENLFRSDQKIPKGAEF